MLRYAQSRVFGGSPRLPLPEAYVLNQDLISSSFCELYELSTRT
jgi:hypothetical protein